MSAIAGIMYLDGAPPEKGDLKRVANKMSMYGSDRSEMAIAGPVGFINALLRVTPEDQFDCQPLFGASGCMITADVRLDNRGALIARIGKSASDAAAWSDSRVLLTAWESLGNKVWQMLRGPFAVAIWDPRDLVLTLARDHLGSNTMSWYRNERFFAFASMPQGLNAFRNIPRQLNEAKFADFLVLNHSDLEATIYKNIFRVLPAHVMTIRLNGSISKSRYWSFNDIEQIRLSSDQAYAEGLRDRLQTAVERQMRSAGGVGFFLSGGLDSASIVTLGARAQDLKGERVDAFTHLPRKGFNGTRGSSADSGERSSVEKIANYAGNIDVTYLHNDDCDDFCDLERMFVVLDGPVRNPMTLGWMLAILNNAQRRGKRVLLCGRHGNLSISWDGWSQTADHLLKGRLFKAYNQWRLFYQLTSLSGRKSIQQLLIDPLLPDSIATWLYRRSRIKDVAPWCLHSPIHPDFAAAIKVEERAKKIGHDFLYRWRPDSRKGATVLEEFDGEWNQAVKAISGIEVRDPTADVDVVSYCLAIPPEQFLAEGTDRSLVRRAMWGLLPESILTNRTRAMQSADWHEKLTRRKLEMASELVTLSKSPLASRMIDLKRISNAIANWPSSGWHTQQITREYRQVLARGLAAARFLAWFESSD